MRVSALMTNETREKLIKIIEKLNIENIEKRNITIEILPAFPTDKENIFLAIDQCSDLSFRYLSHGSWIHCGSNKKLSNADIKKFIEIYA